MKATETQVCATCHRIFEPIGLAMENYDAIGQWRTQVDGTPIDATGTLVDGTEYHSPDFAEQAKEYHQRVLIAHKEHAAVEVPLPTLNGQTASPAGLVAAEEPAPTGPPPGPGRGDGRRSRGNSRRKKKT